MISIIDNDGQGRDAKVLYHDRFRERARRLAFGLVGEVLGLGLKVCVLFCAATLALVAARTTAGQVWADLLTRAEVVPEPVDEASVQFFVTREQLCSLRGGEPSGLIENLLGEATSRSDPSGGRLNLTYEAASGGERVTLIFVGDRLETIIRSVPSSSDSQNPGHGDPVPLDCSLVARRGVPWSQELAGGQEVPRLRPAPSTIVALSLVR
jgi:hypothetical protein